jgi:hypothetical protein
VDLLAGSPPTANTLSDRAVFFDPHFGHATESRAAIDLTRFSNLAWQDWHVYS